MTEKTHYINGVSVSNNIVTLCIGSEENLEKNIEINLSMEEVDKLVCALIELVAKFTDEKDLVKNPWYSSDEENSNVKISKS